MSPIEFLKVGISRQWFKQIFKFVMCQCCCLSWLPRETSLAWGHGPPKSTFGLQRLTPKQPEPEPPEKLPTIVNSPSRALPRNNIQNSAFSRFPEPNRPVPRCATPQNGEYIPRSHRPHSFPLCAQGKMNPTVVPVNNAGCKSRRSSQGVPHGLCENLQQQTETRRQRRAAHQLL